MIPFKRLPTLFKQRSFQTIFLLMLYGLTAASLPSIVHQSFYSASLFIKDILVWLMPITVCVFIAQTVAAFERKAPLFILALVLFETVSNFTSVWYALSIAHIATNSLPLSQVILPDAHFTAVWRLPFVKPSWWAADIGCISGLMLGCMGGFYRNPIIQRTITLFKSKLEWLLIHVFAKLIPVFILGFAAHMYQSGMLSQMIHEYAYLFIWLGSALTIYIIVLFTIGAGFRWQTILQHINHLLPAGTIALTSGCSLSTMPWTIQGTAKNLRHPEMAQAIIPATTNIQQIGDCIANTFLCFVIYRHFYGHNPDFMMLVGFSITFVLARFATAAVIGGAIFIMLPIYETYLNFTPEMVAIILALNIVLDPGHKPLGNRPSCRKHHHR